MPVTNGNLIAHIRFPDITHICAKATEELTGIANPPWPFFSTLQIPRDPSLVVANPPGPLFSVK